MMICIRSLAVGLALLIGFADCLTACTTAVISGRVTIDGRPILWKNRDFASAPRNEVILFRGRNYRGAAVVNAGSKNSIWMGVNEAGLCVENSLSRDLGDGKKHQGPGNGQFMRLVLETCATVEDVKQLLEKTNASGRQTMANMGVIDAQGGACMFEIGPAKFQMFDANDPQVAPRGYIVRSNFSTVAQNVEPTPDSDQAEQLASGDRYLRGCQLLDAYSTPLSISYLIQNVTRDLCDSDGFAHPGTATGFADKLPRKIRTDNTISRSSTVSAAVFHGVKPGEDPRLTTMWTILGDPKFSVAVPCWPTMPEIADALEGQRGAEIGEIARTLRDYSLLQDRGEISTALLPGIWDDVWPVEKQLITKTGDHLTTWRKQGVADSELHEWHCQATEQAYQAMQQELRQAKSFALSGSLANYPDAADTPRQTIPLRVAIYDHSTGTANGPKNLLRILSPAAGFSAKRISPEQIRAGKLTEFDILIMPGGSGSKQSRMLEESGRDLVREFVDNGGGYVGICAGSYLASSHYTWSLDLINSKVWDRAHWARGTGKVTLGMSSRGQAALQHDAATAEVYYGQGPLLVPGNDDKLPSYEVLAVFNSEIATKGAVAESMIDTHAIIRSTFGKGRVICFSPHPETASGPNHLIEAGVRWAGKRSVSTSGK